MALTAVAGRLNLVWAREKADDDERRARARERALQKMRRDTTAKRRLVKREKGYLGVGSARLQLTFARGCNVDRGGIFAKPGSLNFTEVNQDKKDQMRNYA